MDCLADLDTKKQSKVDSFFSFSKTIEELARNRIKENESISSASLLGLTSEDLLQSLELQSDMDLHNELQKTVGSIAEFKLKTRDGMEKSLNDLRRARHDEGGRKAAKLKSHLPHNASPSNVVTPMATPILPNNRRWYNNKLSAIPVDMVSEITSETVQKSGNDASSEMHKEVMKRLLSIDSPPSSKKNCVP